MTRSRYVCPKCGSIDLSVTIVTTARLIQSSNGDEFQTEIDGDHEWGQSSRMQCNACGCADSSGEFTTQTSPEVEHLQTLDLASALWWFIENIDADHKDRSDIFFYLRERVRTETK